MRCDIFNAPNKDSSRGGRAATTMTGSNAALSRCPGPPFGRLPHRKSRLQWVTSSCTIATTQGEKSTQISFSIWYLYIYKGFLRFFVIFTLNSLLKATWKQLTWNIYFPLSQINGINKIFCCVKAASVAWGMCKRVAVCWVTKLDLNMPRPQTPLGEMSPHVLLARSLAAWKFPSRWKWAVGRVKCFRRAYGTPAFCWLFFIFILYIQSGWKFPRACRKIYSLTPIYVYVKSFPMKLESLFPLTMENNGENRRELHIFNKLTAPLNAIIFIW